MKTKTGNDPEENTLSVDGTEPVWYTGVLHNRVEVELFGH